MPGSQYRVDLCLQIWLCSSETRLGNFAPETIRLFASHLAQCFHHGDVPESATERSEPDMSRKGTARTMLNDPSLVARCACKRRFDLFSVGRNGLCKRASSFRHTSWRVFY